MEAAFKFPSDLPLLPQFKAVAAAVGVSRAYHIWFILWSELFFRAQEGQSQGRLPGKGVPAFIQNLAEVEPDAPKRRELFEQVLVAQAGLLEPDGEDYVCPRFLILNGQAGKPSRERMGGNRKEFLRRQRGVAADAMEQSFLLPKDVFVDAEGVPLDGDRVKRVMRLIISCDNALYKPERPKLGYSEGLIQEALKVLARYADEEIDMVVNRLSFHRDHPRLNGMTTEKLLPQFGDMVRSVES